MPPVAAPQPLSHKDLVLRGIKLVDIGFVTVMYFVLGFLCAAAIDAVLGKFDERKADEKSVARIAAELILHIYIIGVLMYVCRNVVELVPFPLDGVHGFMHSKVKELSTAASFGLVLIMRQEHLKAKMAYLHERMFGGGDPQPA